MSKNNILLIAWIIIYYLVTSMSLYCAPVEVLFAYEDQHNFPFYMYSGKQIHKRTPGVSVELLRLLEKKLDIKVKFKRMSWNKCKEKLQKGEVDGIFNASFKKKRMKLGAYPMIDDKPDTTKRITTISYALYVYKDSKIEWNPKTKTFKNLNGKIGAPTGYSIVDNLRKWGAEVDEQEANTVINFNKLLFGIKMKTKHQVAAVATLDLAGDFYLKLKYSDFRDIKKVEPPLVSKPYYLMLSHQFVKKHPKLAKDIWKTIAELRETELDNILKKYFKDE